MINFTRYVDISGMYIVHASNYVSLIVLDNLCFLKWLLQNTK